MEKIYSLIDKDLLLHVIHAKSDFLGGRNDLSAAGEFLQASSISLPLGKEVKAHKHLLQERITSSTQESIIVVSGAIEATYYDLDDKPIKKHILGPGDCTITFGGGHSFKVIAENTNVYELKNGPYQGKEKDTISI